MQLESRVDPDGLLEYSVVYTDRATNHMSKVFQETMREMSRTFQKVYRARAVAIIPGSGTFAMEAVARQFATGKNCLIIRNGWFSYRWTQILDMGAIPSASVVLTARPAESGRQPAFIPPPIDEVLEVIAREQPEVVFAPHVETSAGMMLSDDYLAALAEATHAAGGLLVLDCIASGTIWVDMEKLGVDVLISAPQKVWSGQACCGLVMLGQAACDRVGESVSTSFAMDLKKWLSIMEAYEQGGHAYHATMPTDGLRTLHAVMRETESYGFERARDSQLALGQRIRDILTERGFKSVTAEGFQAPGVVVCYTDYEGIRSGAKFAEQGIQVAAGIPLQCGEGDDFKTFRIGLFGLDKLYDLDGAIAKLSQALDQL